MHRSLEVKQYLASVSTPFYSVSVKADPTPLRPTQRATATNSNPLLTSKVRCCDSSLFRLELRLVHVYERKKPTCVAAPSPRASLVRRMVCGRTEQCRPPVSKRCETKVRMVWGSFLIAAAALKSRTRNGYHAQGVNLMFNCRGWSYFV